MDPVIRQRTLYGALELYNEFLESPRTERDRVHRHFRTTSRYEWMFWDMGYRREAWPV